MQPRAWPLVKRWIDQAANDVTTLKPDAAGGARVLEALGVTERSVLGALAVNTGGLSIDHGWLRVLGGPLLLDWHDQLEGGLVVGHDAAGGFYAVGQEDGEVRYLVPGSYEWMETEMGHAAWVHWTLMGDVEGVLRRHARARLGGADRRRSPPTRASSRERAGADERAWAAQRDRIRPLAGR